MKFKLLPVIVTLLCLPLFGGTKEEIIRLQSDVLQLQDQIRVLQKAVDEKNGMILSLLEQLNDQVAEASAGRRDVIQAVRDQNRQLEETIGELRVEIGQLSAKLDSTDNRVAALHKKMDESQMKIQTLRSVPESGGSVEPDRVYAATYNDYLMGNYELAVAGFQDFLSNYPDSEYADNAAYFLGDSYFKQGRYELAIQAFDQVINLYPKGDKTPVALYKKAAAYESLQRMDPAVDTLKQLTKLFPESPEAKLAQQHLSSLTGSQ